MDSCRNVLRPLLDYDHFWMRHAEMSMRIIPTLNKVSRHTSAGLSRRGRDTCARRVHICRHSSPRGAVLFANLDEQVFRKRPENTLRCIRKRPENCSIREMSRKHSLLDEQVLHMAFVSFFLWQVVYKTGGVKSAAEGRTCISKSQNLAGQTGGRKKS